MCISSAHVQLSYNVNSILRISNVNLCVVGNVTMIFVITIESRKEERYSRVVFIGVRSVPNEVSTIYSYKDDGHLVRRGGD